MFILGRKSRCLLPNDLSAQRVEEMELEGESGIVMGSKSREFVR
jgi:hypothetical protein